MADKKLLEESVIERFQQLANIPKTSKGMLSENKQRTGYPNPEETDRRPTRESKKDWMHEEEEMDAPEGDDAGMDTMDPMAGDDMGDDVEGGDDAIKQAFDSAIEAFNQLANAVPALKNSKVELDTGDEGEGMEEPESDMPVMESEEGDPEDHPMEEAAELDEELDESIELVDDTLIEKLLQRVSARLVAEARKNRELAEGKKGSGGNWLSKPSHSKPPKAKGSPKGKTGTPFTKSVSVKGLAGRGK